MSDWYPAATREPGNDGGSFTGGPPKGLLHTTEGSSYAGALGAYRANNSWPHFTVSFERGYFQCWQHVSIYVAARALKNLSGGVQTNRDHVIQIEIVGRAAAAADLPLAYLNGLAVLMRWIEANAGVPQEATVTFKAPPAPGVRLSGPSWDIYTGWCGHQHAPENDHVDPGAINIGYLLAGGTMALTDQDVRRIADAVFTRVSADMHGAVDGYVIPRLDAIKAKVESLGQGNVDVDAVAVAVASKVADVLAARLAQ